MTLGKIAKTEFEVVVAEWIVANDLSLLGESPLHQQIHFANTAIDMCNKLSISNGLRAGFKMNLQLTGKQEELRELLPSRACLYREDRPIIDRCIAYMENWSELSVSEGLKNIHPNESSFSAFARWLDISQTDLVTTDDDYRSIEIGAFSLSSANVFWITDWKNESFATHRVFTTNPEILLGHGYEFEVIKSGKIIENKRQIPHQTHKDESDNESEPSLKVDEKYRNFVALDHAPNEGDFEKRNGQIYICTGTGKSWYCHDNSHGDPTLEGSYVCYAYFVLADEDQVNQYEQQESEKATIRLVDQQLNKLEEYIKNNGESVAGSSGETIYDSRSYYAGAGYGVGTVWRVSEGGALYMSHYTGSKVSEWAWWHRRMNDTKFVAMIRQLVDGVELTASQLDTLDGGL